MIRKTFQISSGVPYPFGPTIQGDSLNFAVYAKEAESLSICFFEEGIPSRQEIELDPLYHKTGDVWHVLVKGLPQFFSYAYRITPKERSDVNYLLLDPYAKAVASDPHWDAGRIQRKPYRPLGKVACSHTFDWEGDLPPNIPKKDLIIYEMHVRGFTQHSSSQAQFPGTYKGVIEKIPYLIDLGINAVELMPIHEFNERETTHVNPETKKKLHNYFGYSTVNFFSPMNRYASRSDGDQAIIEFKTMVKELHLHGIEVILDVVFNHTFEGNEKGPVLSFKGFDRHAYYMFNEQEAYLNFSGCGNTFNCNHPIAIELIINALRYWVVEMHVDGFRFDLASIFNRAQNGMPIDNTPLVAAITHDPILAQKKLIAEAWDAGGLYQLGSFASKGHWSEWNGKYRDIVRRFIKGTPSQKNIFASAISGSQDLYGFSGTPCASVNFITAHDGFSLADLVSYNEKHNLPNGEDNRDGMNENDSWNCGFEGQTDIKKVVHLRKRQIRNFHLALMISQGIPMLLMGDEYAHTRLGNNNTWCQDNELNWFLWDQLDERTEFFKFYRSLIHFRKNHPLLGRDAFYNDTDIKWHGITPNNPDWQNDNRLVAFTLHFPNGDPSLYVAFNASHQYLDITIPQLNANKSWFWVVDTHKVFPSDFLDDNHSKKLMTEAFRIPPHTAIMLQAK